MEAQTISAIINNNNKYMQTKQAIQTSAKVIRITEVHAGDVYKRFDDYSDIYYGVVKAVHNDGEQTIIEATEYRQSYSSLSVANKIIKGGDDVTIFPSSPDELNLELEDARRNKIKEIEKAEDSIKKYKKEIKDIDGLISGETLKKLNAMSYKELTQEQYNSKKLEAGL